MVLLLSYRRSRNLVIRFWAEETSGLKLFTYEFPFCSCYKNECNHRFLSLFLLSFFSLFLFLLSLSFVTVVFKLLRKLSFAFSLKWPHISLGRFS